MGRDGTTTWRAPAADFSASFTRLRDAVRQACALGADARWEERVAAGIRSALEFAAADPAAAKALTLDARAQRLDGGDRQDEVIAHFAELLSSVAPSEKRFPISTDLGIVQSITTLVRGHLLAGTADRLPGLAADVVYIALMPYAGREAARHWAEAVPLETTKVQPSTDYLRSKSRSNRSECLT